MSVVKRIRDEVADLKLKSHLPESVNSADHERIIEILERQATIIEILGELDREHLKRFATKE